MSRQTICRASLTCHIAKFLDFEMSRLRMMDDWVADRPVIEISFLNNESWVMFESRADEISYFPSVISWLRMAFQITCKETPVTEQDGHFSIVRSHKPNTFISFQQTYQLTSDWVGRRSNFSRAPSSFTVQSENSPIILPVDTCRRSGSGMLTTDNWLEWHIALKCFIMIGIHTSPIVRVAQYTIRLWSLFHILIHASCDTYRGIIMGSMKLIHISKFNTWNSR